MEHTAGVRSFVGIDAHISQCCIKAIGLGGENLLELSVKTSATHLRKPLDGLATPVWVMLESSSMAGYVKDAISSSVARVIVCETRENRWISHSEDKSDPKDAERLARLLRLGEFKEVYLPQGAWRDRREVLRMYQKAQGEVVRTKNRIKGKYREHGIMARGTSVYSVQGRESWLCKLKRPCIRSIMETLYAKLESDRQFRARLLRELISVMQPTAEYRLLQSIPGVGKILAGVLSAVICDFSRFSTKRRLWSYAGLGLKRPWSGDASRGRPRGSSGGNRLLKYAALSAAMGALKSDNRFARHYRKMVEAGIDPAMAKRTVARQILATALAMSRSGRAYREEGAD